MPFTANEFLDVFAAYNQVVWPFAVILWLLTTLVFGALVLEASIPAPMPRFLLAAHWLWAGLVYHAWFFTAINPAARLFAALFVAQGVLFIALGPSADPVVDGTGSTRRVVSSLLIVYSLIYPVVVWADGFAYPRMPTFGVPCPTVVLTIGVLLATSRPSVLLSVIPIGWSVIAASAAWLFGVHADFVLPAAGGVLVVDLIFRSHVMKKLSLETLTIPPEQWAFRLNKLSESFEGWPVSLDVIDRADGRLREFSQIPLLGITVEPSGPIVISVADATGAHVSHIIHAPTRVLLSKTSSGWNAGLEIESADGEKAVLRFRSAEVEGRAHG